MKRRLFMLSEGALKNGIHCVAGPGSGKSRTLGRLLVWQQLLQGKPQVILDPTGAYLEPGEILVAPSTDPGWTPLFLTAGGLVMEMGGTMSHGSVVAREYGIPAVVAVPGATERITTGQLLTVDGSAGTVLIEQDG